METRGRQLRPSRKAVPIKKMRSHRGLRFLLHLSPLCRPLLHSGRTLYACDSALCLEKCVPYTCVKVCRARERAIFSASLFTCPLFISPTRKPRAGLNTRANPIRCKCFRARPSPSLPGSLSLSLFPALFLPRFFPFARSPPSPSHSHRTFFVERLSRCELADISHTGLSFTPPVCARFEAPRSRGLHDDVIASGEGE